MLNFYFFSYNLSVSNKKNKFSIEQIFSFVIILLTQSNRRTNCQDQTINQGWVEVAATETEEMLV